MKYKLKKDLPTIKAGAIFMDKDPADNQDEIYCKDPNGYFYSFGRELIDNFNEWFEVVKEPAYRRQLIKKIHGKFANTNYRAIKAFYLPIGEWIGEHECAYKMKPGEVAGFVGKYDEDVIGYINQMVKLGYIEVEDNPNIVWEDEND